MSLFKIGIIGIVLLILNLFLVNFERVALKIRDYGYSHYKLGQQQQQQQQRHQVFKQQGGAEEKIIFDATLEVKDRVKSLANKVGNKVEDAVRQNAVLNNAVPPEQAKKLGLLLIADLVTILKNNQSEVNNMATQINDIDTERVAQNIMGLQNRILESEEYSALKQEYETRMESPSFREAYQNLLNAIVTTLPQTTLYQLVNKLVTKENNNLTVLSDNITTNLKDEMNKVSPTDQSEELYKLLEPFMKSKNTELESL